MRRTGTLITLLAALALPGAAHAAPTWFAPQPISPFGWAIADADIDPDGNSTALLAGPGGLAITNRAAGGAFGAPQGLPFATGSEPQLGIDDNGGAVVAWRAQPSGSRQATVRAASGAWQTPVNVSPPEDFNSNLWTLDVGGDGTAAIAWLGGPTGMSVRVREPGGGFDDIEEIPLDGHSLYLDAPRLHVDGAGGVHLFMGAYNGDLLHAERPPGGSFGAPEVLMTDAAGMPGAIASSPGGALAVLWTRLIWEESGGQSFETVLFARDADDTDLGPAVTLPVAGVPAIADDGSMQMAWPGSKDAAGRNSVQTVSRSASGVLGPIETLSSTSEQVGNVALGLDESGAAVVMWHQGKAWANLFQAIAEPKRVTAATRAPGGSFGTPVVLSPTTVRDASSDQASALSVSRSGTAVAIWTETTGERSCVKAVVRAESALPGNARTCADVPQPVVPGRAADTTPPGLRFGGSRTLTLTKPVVTLTASCTEACVLSATGSVTAPGASRTFKLKGAKTKLLPAGKKAKLRLKLSKPSFKAIKRALKRKRKVKAVIKVTARDKGGAKRTFKRTLKLRRSR